jgi:hypothetical protein
MQNERRRSAMVDRLPVIEREGWGDVLSGKPIRRVQLRREPRDLWIGVYWDRPSPLDMGWGFELRTLFIYVCLIPCLPLKITLSRVKSRRSR